MAVAASTDAAYFDSALSLAIPFVLLAAWGAGLATQGRRHREETVRAKAHSIAIADAIDAERRRIARELHDVITHTLSVVSVHAGVARHLLATGADARSVERSVGIIEASSRGALDDLRVMLGVLREPDSSPADLRPAPGSAEIEQLAAVHRATHGPVSLRIDAAFDRLPDSYRLTTFRAVQEGLTNIAKHAAGSHAHVHIAMSETHVGIAIDNDDGVAGSGAASDSAATGAADGRGVGLAGLRERVAVFGGSLNVQQPAGGGGFSLVIDLPIPTAAMTHEPVT
jgi:signal transduction histidine kinase